MNMTFGDSLRKWRYDARLTQEGLAKKAGVSVPYISNLERDFSANTRSGKAPRPSEELCTASAKALGVKEDEVRLAAGYAPSILYTGRPETLPELLNILDRAGVEGIMFADGIEAMQDETPRDSAAE